MECNDVSVCVVTNIYSQGQHTYYSYATDTSGNSVQSDVNSVIVVARETDPDPDPIPEECGIDITGLDVSGDIIYYSLRNAGSITETIDYSIKVNGAIIQSGSLSLASGSTRSEQKSYSFGYGSYVVTLQAESDCGVDDSQTITHTRFRPYSCKNPNGYEGEERCDYSEKQRLECRDGYWVRVSGYYDYCENDDDCTSRYLNDYRCDGDVVQRKYRYSDCETEWRDWEVCDYDCYQGKCTSNRYPYDRCTADWKCIDSSHRAYQYSDCSWGNSYYCHYGCDDGYCESREYQCTAGWKCKESNNKAYQYSDCSWGQSYYCPKGCSGGACYVQPNPPRPEPPSDRCGIEIENLRYSNNVLQGETAFVEFNSRNTGRYSDTITYKLIVDSVLVDSETRSLSSGSMYFKRFEYRPVAGQHGLRIVAEANCGASDVRLASMVVNGRGSPLPPIPPVYPEITSIDVTPKQLDIVPFESKVFAIEIDSAISQSFTFDIVGMESDWISFSSVVYVGKGEKNVYVYVSPQDDGIFPLTINVKALTENREFSRVVRVYVSQPGEPACGLFSQPLSYSDKSPTTSQRPISGLVIAGDTPYWFAGLLIVAIIVALFVLREFMKRREKKTEGFAAQEINNQQYPYHVSS